MVKAKVVLKNKKSGKFAVNPNSKRQQKLREAAERKQAAVNGGNADAVKPAQNTVEPSQTPVSGPDNAHDAIPIETVDVPQEHSHVAGWFPEPAKEPEIVETIIGEDDDEGNEDDGEPADKPRPSRARRARAKMLAEQFVKGSDGLFSMYVGARHAEWLSRAEAGLRAQGEEKKADMISKLGSLTETEKAVLTESVARYIEENNIELSPGAELGILMASLYGGRIVGLEGALMAMKKGGG